MTIWCLFGIYNDHNQPDFDLYGWWSKKPEYKDLSECFSYTNVQEEMKNILDGQTVRIGEVSYRLREIQEGVKLEKESE
jgi:hypothetical protein